MHIWNGTNSPIWVLEKFKNSQTNGTKSAYSGLEGDLLTTGASSTTEKYHIYDLAGNAWEWTNEQSGKGTAYKICRGGTFCVSSDGFSACYRWGDESTDVLNFSLTYRPILYVK